MQDRIAVDPELAPILEIFPVLELSDASIGEIRRMMGLPKPNAPTPVIAPREEFASTADSSPPVRVLIFDPPGRTSHGVLLHMHGGGVVLGSADVSSLTNAALALELGIMVVSVDYRLAPEAAYPAALDDCLTAYDWLLANADRLGIDAGAIAVGGESAGGLLAAAMCLKARDTSRPLPCLQVLTYPMLDHRTGTEEQPGIAGTGDFIWTPANNRYAWQAMRGDWFPDGTDTGWYSPAVATDLSNLPPAWIGVGSVDLFLDEDLDYARKLAIAGVAVELQVYPGAFHGFDMVEAASVTCRYRSDIRRALRQALGLQAS